MAPAPGGRGSVSASTPAPVVDVEEGLGLPQVGRPLGHLGRWRLWAKMATDEGERGDRGTRPHLGNLTCLLDHQGRPDFGEGGGGSVLGAGPVDVEVGVGGAVQRTEPVSGGHLGVRQLWEGPKG